MTPYLTEEAVESVEAIASGDLEHVAEELGDLSFLAVFCLELLGERGGPDLAAALERATAKLVRRHPHVFGDAQARTTSDVNRQWERIKADERAGAAGEAADGGEPGSGGASVPAPKGALDGVSRILPALAASQEMQERAANIGYEWPSIEGVLDKVTEELGELASAATDAERAEEYGDLLFVLVNVARWQGIEAEAALRAANDKFRRRFWSVERQAASRGVALRDLDFEALDALWDAAKQEERAPHLAGAIEEESPT